LALSLLQPMAKFFVAQQCSPVRHTPKLWRYKQLEQIPTAQRCTPRSNLAATPEKLARAHNQLSWQKFLV
jgi:hypothetical protein